MIKYSKMVKHEIKNVMYISDIRNNKNRDIKNTKNKEK